MQLGKAYQFVLEVISVFKLNTRKRVLMDKENEMSEMEEQHEAKRQLLFDQEEAMKTSELVIQTALNEKGKTKSL